MRFQITFDYFGNPGVRTQEAAAGHYLGGQSSAIQFRCMSRAVSRVIVIAQDHNCIHAFGWLVHQPELRCQAQQRIPHDIKERQESNENEEGEEPKEDAAVFGPPHSFGSIWRRRSAACSGDSELI